MSTCKICGREVIVALKTDDSVIVLDAGPIIYYINHRPAKDFIDPPTAYAFEQARRNDDGYFVPHIFLCKKERKQ